jgi:hypothetical protein
LSGDGDGEHKRQEQKKKCVSTNERKAATTKVKRHELLPHASILFIAISNRHPGHKQRFAQLGHQSPLSVLGTSGGFRAIPLLIHFDFHRGAMQLDQCDRSREHRSNVANE